MLCFPRVGTRRSGAVVIALGLFCAVAAQAQPVVEGREREADTLFQEGRALLDQGLYEAAATRFERSAALLPSAGVSMNLANCYEQLGHWKKALITFEQAIAEAERSTEPARRELQVTEGKRRRQQLLERLPEVTLIPSPTANVGVAVDGVATTEGVLRLDP